MGSVYRPTYTGRSIDGTTEKRKADTFWISYFINGRRVRENAHTRNRTEAVRLLKQKIGQAMSGKPVGPHIDRTTLEDLERFVLDDYAINGKRSLIRVREAFQHLKSFFGGWKVNQITTDALTRYARARIEGVLGNRRGKKSTPAKAGTVNRELAYLRRGFHLALDAGAVGIIPKFKLLTEHNVRAGFFERQDLENLLAESPHYLRAVYKAAYITGWRIKSELLTRMWQHVDFEHGWLRLEPGETKNGQARDFPLTAELRTLLKRQFDEARSIEGAMGVAVPWLFFHPDGTRIRVFRTSWRGATRRAGLHGRTPHDFRRSAVRNLERSGVPRSAAMKMTGHLTESVYRRYAIVDAMMLQDAAVKLAAYHASESRLLGGRSQAVTYTSEVVPDGQSMVKASLTNKSDVPSA